MTPELEIADLSAWSMLQPALEISVVEVGDEVRSYLERHSDMYGLTGEICKAVRQEFGPGALVTLHVYRDPEIEDEYLSLNVRMPAYGTETVSRMRAVADRFDGELSQSSGSILITTDFRPIQ